MSYPYTYHLPAEPRLRGGGRSGNLRTKQRLWSFPAFLVIALMALPVDYLASVDCPMMEDACDQMEMSDCCPLPEEEQKETADTDKTSSCDGDQASGDHEECLSCMDCGCYFTPYTGDNQNSQREATLSDLSAGLQTSGAIASFITHYPIEHKKPVSSPLPRPVPLYVMNQVFLN